MERIIVAQYVADWVEPYAECGEGIPLVIVSNHPEYTSGTRFDYGFLQVALAQGYSILILPSGKSMTKTQSEIYGDAEPIDFNVKEN